ncbi:unnamed protein product [Durusdinium trenchii]|uniref:J domain-containing protein n=1 Tax=Durusdinium trenchii TaxID=1381693 RepID=A0ABP0J2E3_9DINO
MFFRPLSFSSPKQVRTPFGLNRVPPHAATHPCEARSIEVSETGACALRGCHVKGARVGVSLRGPVTLEQIQVSDSVIGISVFGNLDICLHSCHLRCCSAAGLVYHVDMPMNSESTLVPMLRLVSCTMKDCARDLEVRLHVSGAEAVTFDCLPIPSGKHDVARRGGQWWKLEVSDAGHISWFEPPIAEPPKPRKKRARRALQVEMSSPLLSLRFGPNEAWACELLGLNCEELTLQQLGAAYRRKAREVHPDKQPHAAQSTSSFHKVSAAYEALLACFSASPVEKRRRRGEAVGKVLLHLCP